MGEKIPTGYGLGFHILVEAAGRLALRLLRRSRPSLYSGPPAGPESSHRCAVLLELGTRILIRTASPTNTKATARVAFGLDWGGVTRALLLGG